MQGCPSHSEAHDEPSDTSDTTYSHKLTCVSGVQDYSNSSGDESNVSDVYDEDSDQLFGFLYSAFSSQSSQLSPSVTASASSPSTPLLSPATRLATVSLGQIQIHSPNPTSESDTDMASVTTTHQRQFVFRHPNLMVNDLPLKETVTVKEIPSG